MTNVNEWPLARNQADPVLHNARAADEVLVYESLRYYWHPVAYAQDLGDSPLGVTLLDTDIVLARIGGEVRCYLDLCAHRGTALSLGCVTDNQTLRCPYHGWEYNAEGTCVHIPQRPDLVGHLRPRIRRLEAVESGGLIWVTLTESPIFDIPRFPHWDDADFDKHVIPEPDWDCSAQRRTENYTDLSHFAIVHDGFLGDVNHPEVPAHRCWREEGVLRMELLEPQLEPTTTAKNAAIGGEGALAPVTKQWHIYMPLTVLLESRQPTGECYVLFFHPTPVGRNRTANFTIAARNFGELANAQQEIVDFGQEVYRQDRPIVESQRPTDVPHDLSQEMYLKDAEVLAVEYRRWLVNLARELVGGGKKF